MSGTRFFHGLLLAAMTAVLLTPAMATATSTTSHLTLTIASKNRAEEPRTVLLRCEPTGGTHPRAAEACESLLAAGGDFNQIGQAQTGAQCTMVLRPVVASAHGTWQGTPVHFDKEFGNSCQAASNLGSVFDF